MIQHSANTWASLNRTLLHKYRMELVDHMEGVLKRREHEKYGKGRGIVTVAGNADTLQRVKWSLQMLRSYGSELPVEIASALFFSINKVFFWAQAADTTPGTPLQYHFPSEAPPADDPIRTELAELGARLVEAKGQTRDKGKNKSYHLKALAVVQCPWQEVLYIDSDSVPTRDPLYMFDAPNYKRLGIWATPDYWKTSANNPIWAIMGVKCRNEWEMETGQMFIDKKRHLDVFLLVQYMLENHHFVSILSLYFFSFFFFRLFNKIWKSNRADKERRKVVCIFRRRQGHLSLGSPRSSKTMGRPRPLGGRWSSSFWYSFWRFLRAYYAPTRFMGRTPLCAL